MKVYAVVKVNYDHEELEWVEVCKSFQEVREALRQEGIKGVKKDDIAIQSEREEGVVYYIEEVGI